MTGGTVPPEYVAARRALLDALLALRAHLDAIVLVGAQAVYLHAPGGDFAVAPTTTDADVVLSPDRLATRPLLEEALLGAGFAHGENPGTWRNSGDVAIDLMVPDALSPPGGRRGVRLPVHGNRVARRTLGLEAAIVDNNFQQIAALESGDPRTVALRVAGPAALIVAKVIKIAERLHAPRRLQPKDGLDLLRLLRFIDMSAVARTLRRLAGNELSGPVTAQAVKVLRSHGCQVDGPIAALAATALPDASRDTTVLSFTSLVEELLDEYESFSG